jgi:hypothetical protein
MSATTHTADIMVCTDCYFAHHYGTTSQPTADGGTVWYSGDSDTPADCEPLARLAGCELSDNAYGESYDGLDWSGEGVDAFSWSTCEGCGSTLGGARYRLAVWS